MTEYVRVLCDRIGRPAEYRPPAGPIVKAQVLCDYKVLYATDHPPILVDQKANLLKITESQKLNWIQIFNLPTERLCLNSPQSPEWPP